MQLVNFSHERLDTHGVSKTHSEKTSGSWMKSSLLPLGILAAAIVASVVLGSHVSPRDELDWLTRLANQGDTGAQLQLGLAYRDGRYGPADTKTGFYWLQRSAAGGNAFAEDTIGKAYAEGLGTTRNIALAKQWWRKAIKHGDPEARIHLADSLIQSGHTREGNALLN
jgi:uncharacterized protein